MSQRQQEQRREDRRVELDLTITPAAYAASSDDPQRRNLHDTIPYAVFDRLEDEYERFLETGEYGEYQQTFDVKNPNRLFVEGDDSGEAYWQDTEDFILTGSWDGGSMVLCQVASCREKEGYAYDKIKNQLDSFESSPHNRLDEPPLASCFRGKYGVAVDADSAEVREIEQMLGTLMTTDDDDTMRQIAASREDVDLYLSQDGLEPRYTPTLLVREYPMLERDGPRDAFRNA